MQMERLKEPEMLLSVANAAGLVGVVGYFYKQMETIRQDINKVTEFCKVASVKLKELEKTNQGRTEDIRNIGSQIKLIGDQIATFEEDVIPDLDEVIHTLEDNKMPIKRQVYVPPQRQKKTSRSSRSRDVDTDRSNRSGRGERRPAPKQRDNHSDDDAELINAVRGENNHSDEEFTARR